MKVKTKRKFGRPVQWSVRNRNGFTEYVKAKTYKQAVRLLSESIGLKTLDLRTLKIDV